MKVKVIILIVLICLISVFIILKLNNSSNVSSTVITAEEAKVMMEEYPNCLILDVRTQEEYDQGHIQNSILIPYDNLNADTMKQYTDKNETILVYCRSGRRSSIACQTLIELGYSNVYDFGGIQDWSYQTVK